MNAVSLVGELVADPELGRTRAGIAACRMRLAVPRRDRTGRRAPGVVYVDVTTYGTEAQECSDRLRLGNRVGLSGRLTSDPPREGMWVIIDQLDLL